MSARFAQTWLGEEAFPKLPDADEQVHSVTIQERARLALRGYCALLLFSHTSSALETNFLSLCVESLSSQCQVDVHSA